jgi:prefoldin subunit 5
MAQLLSDASELFKAKMDAEQAIQKLQAQVSAIDAQIVTASANIGPLSEALTAYVSGLRG